MLISLAILATMTKFQKNICFKMRAVGLIININTKECKGGCHLRKWSNMKAALAAEPSVVSSYSYFLPASDFAPFFDLSPVIPMSSSFKACTILGWPFIALSWSPGLPLQQPFVVGWDSPTHFSC